jgi:competence protein ComEA
VGEPFLDRLREWRADRRVVAAVLAFVALGAGVAWMRAGTSASAAPPQASRPRAAAPAGAAVATTSLPDVVVDVVGAVHEPGVVTMRMGARIVDAIRAAGGTNANADVQQLDLAARLVDGERIAVPKHGETLPPAVDPSGASGGDPSAPGTPVDLNTATAAELDALPGVGPATAAAIVRDREQHGPFHTVDDLSRVRGIGPAKLAQLHDLVTV